MTLFLSLSQFFRSHRKILNDKSGTVYLHRPHRPISPTVYLIDPGQADGNFQGAAGSTRLINMLLEHVIWHNLWNRELTMNHFSKRSLSFSHSLPILLGKNLQSNLLLRFPITNSDTLVESLPLPAVLNQWMSTRSSASKQRSLGRIESFPGNPQLISPVKQGDSGNEVRTLAVVGQALTQQGIVQLLVSSPSRRYVFLWAVPNPSTIFISIPQPETIGPSLVGEKQGIWDLICKGREISCNLS